ncbi:hypothetical protein [Aquimarina algiphila]|uniref:Uncharacterized protein n=1 Tax=Aquimarina algiphila TaxID=2047982 RepID=A0A554VFD7_9FLAO|nr:hypothetical protein [Aquimarina algiphila]TSE05865.1 hypothetical protein FOF46_21340 [Aquimarina algiphila]
MKKITLSIFLMLLYSSLVNSQINDKSNNLVSPGAFNKLVFQDLNFLVLGDNTPQQGLLFELKEEKSLIKASGYLKSFNFGFFTVDGDFSVDNGVYFFDENDGSKKSKFTVNFYSGIGKSSRKYNGSKDVAIQRAFIKKNLFLQDSLTKYFYRYKDLREEMLAHNLPVDTSLSYDKMKEKLIKVYEIDVDDPKYSIHRESTDMSVYTVKERGSDRNLVVKNPKKDTIEIDQTLTDGINVLKLIQDYEKATTKLDSVISIAQKKEIEITNKSWNSKLIPFFGVSAFYQRESTTLYEPSDGGSFDDFFNDITGDLYGISGSFNVVKQWKNQSYFVARGLTSFSRSSNIDEFTQQTITLNTPTGDIIDGNPVTIASSKKGYVGDSSYTYGFKQSYSAEFYLAWKNLGAFVNVGYDNMMFSEESGVSDLESYPGRLGLLLNLKSKDEEKNILTLQLFMDRQDLNKSPNGDDKDLRFGFKVGLPINISKKL